MKRQREATMIIRDDILALFRIYRVCLYDWPNERRHLTRMMLQSKERKSICFAVNTYIHAALGGNSTAILKGGQE